MTHSPEAKVTSSETGNEFLRSQLPALQAALDARTSMLSKLEACPFQERL